MAIWLGDIAPDFDAETTEGRINFYAWKGSDWAVLFSHPRDFTGLLAAKPGARTSPKTQLVERRVKVIGLSVDALESHDLSFPIIADPDRTIANAYDVIRPKSGDTPPVRSVFVIGPDNKVKSILTYPASRGRNFQELLRTIDSLPLSGRFACLLAAHDEVETPVDWWEGEDVNQGLLGGTLTSQVRLTDNHGLVQ